MLKDDIITGLKMKVAPVAYESSGLLFNETRSGYLIGGVSRLLPQSSLHKFVFNSVVYRVSIKCEP